jgi:hypothetical protein
LEDVQECCFKKYRDSVKSILGNNVFLHNLGNREYKEILKDNDFGFLFEIGSFLVFDIRFQQKENLHYTFKINDIKVASKMSTFFKLWEKEKESLF